MFNIGSFLGKFNSVALKEIKKREVVMRAIEKTIGTQIDIKDISFNNKTIQINGGPGLKSQLFMKKEAILSQIRTELPNLVIDELR